MRSASTKGCPRDPAGAKTDTAAGLNSHAPHAPSKRSPSPNDVVLASAADDDELVGQVSKGDCIAVGKISYSFSTGTGIDVHRLRRTSRNYGLSTTNGSRRRS